MVDDLDIEIYCDGADLESMAALAGNVVGFTTNPSLVRKAGITNYREFAEKAITIVGSKPISFEVFSDDFAGMAREAREIASWGKNVYVKIPITNTKGESTAPLIETLASDGIKVNVTAILTREQSAIAVTALDGAPGIVSIFAGRIADTGIDPAPVVREARRYLNPRIRLIWASTREVLNIGQAEAAGCDIITASPGIIAKLGMRGRDLDEFITDWADKYTTFVLRGVPPPVCGDTLSGTPLPAADLDRARYASEYTPPTRVTVHSHYAG